MTVSMPHLKIKFVTSNSIVVCAGDQKVARDAYLEALREDCICVLDTEMDSRPGQDSGPEEPTEEVILDEKPGAHDSYRILPGFGVKKSTCGFPQG